MEPKWRKLDLGHRSAAENMALNEVILSACNQGVIPNTFRFLQFRPHCALVGYFQEVEQEIRVEYCQKHNIDINRRITGGGAIYFDESTIGWEIYARKDGSVFGDRIENLYARLCEGAVLGLKHLGVKAQFRPRNDIEVEGRKISGTGGTELENAFLFQGTLLVDFDGETMLKALKIPVEKLKDKEIESVKKRVVCLKEVLGFVPSNRIIKEALARGMAEVLEIDMETGDLTCREQTMLAQRLPYFSSMDWIHKVSKKENRRKSVNSVYKGPGGLIRVSLVIDVPGKRIKSAIITGDFFAYPGRIIMDLETALKDCRAEAAVIRDTVASCFRKGQAQLPGLTAEDFCQAIMAAVEAGGERGENRDHELQGEL